MAQQTNMSPVLCYTGFSGAGIGTAVALVLARKRNPLHFNQVYVRKPDETSHHAHLPAEHNFTPLDGVSGQYPERVSPSRRYFGVFLDDMIASGKTYQCVKACMAQFDIEILSRYLSNESLIYQPWLSWQRGEYRVCVPHGGPAESKE